ncbi:MAG: ABC transporter permease [Planctomycetes bacterium]|nr:ABC transporter permease [Planctomycetota bacterium]
MATELAEAAALKAAPPGPSLSIDALEVKLGADVLRLQAPLRLQAGRLYVVWGPSGSGKSSFVRALLGLGELAAPRVAVRGEAVLRDAAGIETPLWSGESYNPGARRQIAFLPQAEKLGFIDGLSTSENLRLYSALPAGEARTHAEHLAARFHLMSLPVSMARASGGERMRLSAVRALLPRGRAEAPPALLIADEPTTGLDALAAQSLARELIAFARRRDAVVMVITHDPQIFTGSEPEESARAQRTVRVYECAVGEGHHAPIEREAGQLRLEAGRPVNPRVAALHSHAAEYLNLLGGAVLSPLALLWGLLGLRRLLFVARRVAGEALSPGTHLFALLGALLVGGTVAYFIFEQMPRPELVEPLLLQEILQATGHTLVRVVLPLAACALVAGKLGAAQAARLSAGVRSGMLETLALARWSPEGFALAPAVLAQGLAMAVAATLATISGVALAALVYVAGHEGASLGLGLSLMLDGLDTAAHWREFLLAKVLVSGFLGGALAALFGLAPATSEDDVARAVHRTLLWGVLAVIAAQCALIVWEFSL